LPYKSQNPAPESGSRVFDDIFQGFNPNVAVVQTFDKLPVMAALFFE
jgi:hypothetical protein